mmetsp:Transcript_39804/g.83334  ORF Transcript_39804/g.83334 Transcript_39804/m.83334 type:complete len:83 (-) Transcript_39804:155-403(-)
MGPANSGGEELLFGKMIRREKEPFLRACSAICSCDPRASCALSEVEVSVLSSSIEGLSRISLSASDAGILDLRAGDTILPSH